MFNALNNLSTHVHYITLYCISEWNVYNKTIVFGSIFCFHSKDSFKNQALAVISNRSPMCVFVNGAFS